MGGGAARIKNHAQQPLGLRQHLIVPKADDTIARRFEPGRARVAVIRMLPAVDLDDE